MESLIEERRQRLQEQWRQLYASHDLETRVDEKMRIKAIIDSIEKELQALGATNASTPTPSNVRIDRLPTDPSECSEGKGQLNISPTLPITNKRFLVALSFPGEQRKYVEKVANALAKTLGRKKIFYDKWYTHELARPNLDTHLQKIYHDDTVLIVPFLCADYERKKWCGLEWRAIRDLLNQRDDNDIMPLRFDDTQIPGMFSIDGYIDLSQYEPAQIARFILNRLNSKNIATPDTKEPTPKLKTTTVSILVAMFLVFAVVVFTYMQHPLDNGDCSEAKYRDDNNKKNTISGIIRGLKNPTEYTIGAKEISNVVRLDECGNFQIKNINNNYQNLELLIRYKSDEAKYFGKKIAVGSFFDDASLAGDKNAR